MRSDMPVGVPGDVVPVLIGSRRYHHAYLLRRGGDRLLFCGDLVFGRGR